LTNATTNQRSSAAPIDEYGQLTDDLPGSEFPVALRRNPCHLEVLIPARNEAGRLPRTLARTIEYLDAQQYSAAVVVIDNGSFDHTADIATAQWSGRVPVYVTGCVRPGKGAAVRHGLLGSQADFVGYMDADLATPIETLDVILPLLERYQAVVGSRYVRGATLVKRQPLLRSAGGMVFHRLARRVLPGIADTQCGFKFFSGEFARMIAPRLTVDGFAFDVEMLRIVHELGGRIKEVPVAWTDSRGSSLSPFRDGARATMELARLIHRRRSALCRLSINWLTAVFSS
jgi:glycosyltransferase involved in cell wall biosynthesis